MGGERSQMLFSLQDWLNWAGRWCCGNATCQSDYKQGTSLIRHRHNCAKTILNWSRKWKHLRFVWRSTINDKANSLFYNGAIRNQYNLAIHRYPETGFYGIYTFLNSGLYRWRLSWVCALWYSWTVAVIPAMSLVHPVTTVHCKCLV